MNSVPGWTDLFGSLFFACLFIFAVYAFLKLALVGWAQPEPAKPKEGPNKRTKTWMVLVSLVTPPCLLFCYMLAQGPGSNAMPGFGQFLAGLIGIPCVVVFLASGLIFLKSLPPKE